MVAEWERGTLLERAADAVVGVFSSKARARRVHARLCRDPEYRKAAELTLRAMGYARREYKAASSGPSKTPWLGAVAGDADSQISGSAETLRQRHRALYRDDSIGGGVIRLLARNVIGTSLRPQSRITNAKGDPDREKSRKVEAVWGELSKRLHPADGWASPAQHQHTVYTSLQTDGDVLIKPAAMAGEPVWLETVEAERIATPAGAKVQTGHRISDGVEKDALGRVVAYWVMKTHPGSHAMPALSRSDAFERVPVGSCKLLRRGALRPGQSRAVGVLHACAQDIHDLDLLLLAALKRWQVAACLAVFITSSEDTSDLLEVTAQDFGYQLQQRLEPGMFFKLFPGEQVSTLSPNLPVGELDPLVWIFARRIGASVGVSPQAILHAWAGISYSGARTIFIEDERTYAPERTAFADGLLSWEWEVALTDAKLRGDPRLRDVTVEEIRQVQWIGDGRKWVDPAKEAAAVQTKLSAGLTTLQIECARLGLDWEDVLRQQAVERALMAELGLSQEAPAAPQFAMVDSDSDDDEAVAA